PDLTSKNIAKITELFPNVITEKEDENGRIVKAVDFDLLRQELSKDIVDGGDERYRLDWPGKRRSMLKANTPINKTLKPDRDSSVNFDTTENVYIEGDNFEVLKIIQESYLGKIKMIYIDPPYNTGKDFIYRDNFKISKNDYEGNLGIENEEGGKLFKNTDTNGRFHSDWLSMMYERLLIARDLLKDDGVIFISIDDNEVHNLRKICDEIFGEENIETMVWDKVANQANAGSGKMKITYRFRKDHEYILVIFKNKIETFFNKPLKIFEYKNEYGNKDNDPRGNWLDTELCKSEEKSIEKGKNYYEIELPSGKKIARQWHITKQEFEDLNNDNRIYWGSGNSLPRKKVFLNEPRPSTPISVLKEQGGTTEGINDMNILFNGNLFENPKSIRLIKYLLEICIDPQGSVLDFFSGSSTTAHAVMQLNAEDGGNRKFIMVQIPEKTNEKSEAYKAGYKTIADIGRERIRRAGKRILEENAERLAQREKPLDIGFRSYKVADSIMQDVYKSPNELKQSDLLELADNIKRDKSPGDILTSVILDLGLTLDLPIKEEKIGKNIIYNVADGSLLACFDKDIDFSIIDEIAKIKPLRVVFRDASFKDDKDRINVETKFKQLSPDTRIKVL
ncbi:MAG: site-specific DNA-methyltransferase, partial [Epulopiscium sp.]|nr:site-specific DNA-methyltransferase [Candidatus Epulonipiscium sp.]